MPVAEMRARVSHDEYVGWRVYHARIAQRHEAQMNRARRG